MAIDDNTLYGLTGAQVKELPERINAVKGLARELTTDDYDWPTDNPDGIALWKWPIGWYSISSSSNPIKVYVAKNYSKVAYAGLFSVTQIQNNKLIGKWMDDMGDFGARFRRTNVDGSAIDASWNNYYLLGNNNIANNLTTTDYTKVLSANQGKILKDLIDSIAIRGAGAPTTSTVGEVGQLYEDGTNGVLYQLKSIDITVTPNTYNWEQVGGSSVNVVQATGTSTTDVMSQNATTSMVYADPTNRTNVQIGANANGTGYNRVSIGRFAYSSAYSVAIGGHPDFGTSSTRAEGSHSVAIKGQATADYSVAIGSEAKATQKGQMDISTLATTNTNGYNDSQYRLLTGLYDPQSAHDAATKGYVDTAVSGAGGASLTNTEFNTIFGTNLTGGA